MREKLSLFNALSNETRLKIVVLLSKGEFCVCQLQWALRLSQAKTSRHLAVLKNVGLIQNRREGLWIFYSLVKPKNELGRIIQKYFKECLVTEYNLIKTNIVNMKKCVDLQTRRRA